MSSQCLRSVYLRALLLLIMSQQTVYIVVFCTKGHLKVKPKGTNSKQILANLISQHSEFSLLTRLYLWASVLLFKLFCNCSTTFLVISNFCILYLFIIMTLSIQLVNVRLTN